MLPLSGFRVCRKCGLITPYDQLIRHKGKREGVDSLCRPCHNDTTNQWKKSHPRQRNQIHNKWVSRNKGSVYARNEKYRQNHREEINENTKRRRKLTKERTNELNRQSRKRHPETTRIKNHRRRALVMKAEGKHTVQDIQAQLNSQNGFCWWCSKPLDGIYHIDHVIPLNRGGTNWPKNIVCTCPSCNSSKNDRLPYIEWQPPCPLVIAP